MKKAMYAFSGDPITYGHIDIIRRAAKVFDKLIVGIGANPNKKYTFSLQERTDMAKKSLENFENVEVIEFKGLLVDYAYENKIDVIVKGVRNSADFNYENVLHQIGESQKLGIDTHILFAKPELAHISSSTVKSIQIESGLIHEYVPLYVKQQLEKKISNQFIVGVTGEIGSGKSYVSEQIKKFAKDIEVHNIELDHIGHQILEELKEERYDEVRKEIIKEFKTIDRKVLGEIVFNDKKALNKLNEIMKTPLLVRLRKELHNKKGLILINAALIAESDMAYLCNNNIILTKVDKEIQKQRLMQRNLTEEQIQRRLESQFDYKKKKEHIEQAIQRNNQGHIWEVKDNIEEITSLITQKLV